MFSLPDALPCCDGGGGAGGRARLFADRQLNWAGELPRHLPRPPRTSLIRPLLSHWGLELLPGEPGFRIMRPSSSAMVRVGVHSPGKLRSRTSDCTISMNGLMADCAIGKGRALVLEVGRASCRESVCQYV